MSIEELVARIRATCTDFCAALTKDEVWQFSHYVSVKQLEKDEVLADVGQVGDSFYLVIGGSVKLYQVDGDKEFEVGEVLPGGLVGEMSFFDRKPRTVRLKAPQAAELVEINHQTYNRLRIQEPYISSNMLEFVIRSLDGLVRRLSEQNADLHKRLDG